MRLEYLELQGFKTFPNKTRLSFWGGISAVVGPNGSGKSNISDAMRWALGEQSAKVLRCIKMEDIIFAGSGVRKPLGFASVTLAFNNKDRKLMIDQDEVSVTRRYYRSGESEYFINMKPAKLKELNELFMDTGIGKDGYSIIGQGRIDSIVSAKPSDRREIFEEAAGISRYRYRREEARVKLSRAEDNLARIRDILSELESRLKPLEKQSKDATLYIEYAEKKKLLEIGLWLNTLDEYGSKLEQCNKNKEILASQKIEADTRLKEIEDKLFGISGQGNSMLAVCDKQRWKISEYESRFSSASREICVLQNDIKHNGENVIRVKNEISDAEIELKSMEQVLESENKELDKKEDEVRKKICDLESLRKELLNLEEKVKSHTSDGSELSERVRELEQLESDKKVEKLLTEASIVENNARLEDINQNKEKRVIYCEDLSKKLNEKTDQINKLEKGIESLSLEISEYNSIAEKLKCKYDGISRELAILSNQSEECLGKIRILQELERSMEGFSKSVKSVIRESDAGRLKGIKGPVSRLITVPSEYAMAIDTALSSSMQNIVTENEEDAKRAIEFLKKSNSGRATFLPITVIRGNRIDITQIKDFKGFKGLASDICKCDNEYNNILDWLLGRTVIADNLDNAVLMARKFSHKFRIVTIDGQVVNPGGSLTGGATSVRSGYMGRASELSKLREIYGNLSGKLDNMREQAANLKNNLKERESKLCSLESQSAELKRLNTEYRSEYNGIKMELDLKIKASNEIEAECSEIKSKTFTLEEKLLDIDKDLQGISKEKIELGIEYKNALKSEEKFSCDIKKVNDDIQEMRISLNSSEKEVEAIKYRITSTKREIEIKKARICKLRNDMDHLGSLNHPAIEKIKVLEQEINELKEKKHMAGLKIDEINAQRADLEKRASELRKEEKEISNQTETVIRELTRLEERGNGAQKEYDLIISKLWDEYGMTRTETEEKFSITSDKMLATKQLAEIKSKIRELGTVNVAAVEEYKEVKERYGFMSDQVRDIEKSGKELGLIINNLTKDMKNLFMERFNEINNNFSIVMRELFGGGGARLLLTDPENTLSSGIDISVRLPGKAEIHMEALSGGEKALVAISLYFAIMKVSPPPFCVLDEIEAALDDVNVERFAAYLRKISSDTQFIVITHRRGTMEEADVLYGVTMHEEGTSFLLELKTSEIMAGVVRA